MRNRNLSSSGSTLLLAICSLPLGAMGSESPQQCAGVSDDRARLACYDRIFRSPPAPERSSPTATPTPATVPAAPASGEPAAAAATSPQDDFGLSEAAKRARDPETAKSQMPESLTDRVFSVERRQTGEMVLTLDNGQVWAQIEPDSKARVGAGDTVTIRKAALGSYLLVTPSKVATRVRRVK